jgi:hypothetical protein
MHGLGSEVGLSAARARPHWNAFNNQQVRTLAKGARDVFQLGATLPAVHALLWLDQVRPLHEWKRRS